MTEKNKTRNKAIFQHLKSVYSMEKLKKLQLNLIVSLILGSAENYAKLWLLEKFLRNRPNIEMNLLNQLGYLLNVFITDQ